MAPPPKHKNLTYKYEKVNDFKTTQVHGVYGGINLRGQLNINFYVECLQLAKTTHSPINGNVVGAEVFPDNSEPTTLRELHFGINLDLELAKSMVQWMSKHINEFENKLIANKTMVDSNSDDNLNR